MSKKEFDFESEIWECQACNYSAPGSKFLKAGCCPNCKDLRENPPKVRKIKLKDKEFTIANIKVSKVREVTKAGKGSYSFKDKFWCVKINKDTVINSTCFKGNKTGFNEMIRFIRREI